MQHQKNKSTQTNLPTIKIEGGGRTYQVALHELSCFLDTIEERLSIASLEDLEVNLQAITDLVIDGVEDDRSASILKNPLILLREITFMFKAVLWDRTPKEEETN